MLRILLTPVFFMLECLFDYKRCTVCGRKMKRVYGPATVDDYCDHQ